MLCKVNNLPVFVLSFHELFGCKQCTATKKELGHRGDSNMF